jgi:hypothetical protein
VFKGVRLTGADVFWLEKYAGEGPPRSLPDARSLVPDLQLQGAILLSAQLQGAYLYSAQLQGAILYSAQLQGANLGFAELQGANLSIAQLQSANLRFAQLQGAGLEHADLQGANLESAQLQGASLVSAELQGANLTAAHMNVDTTLTNAILDAQTRLTNVVWNDAPLTQVVWPHTLGDETEARNPRHADGKPKRADMRRVEFAAAVRANRVLAVTLRDQGLNDDADRYGYRAQVLQRQVLRRQGRLLSAIGSRFLDLVAGYGYKPMRSFITYLLVVLGFAAAYFALGGSSGKPLSWNEAIVVSMTAFHGRGFFAAVFQPGDLQAAVAAVEAFIGLLIEIVFIATFTQRFFAR